MDAVVNFYCKKLYFCLCYLFACLLLYRRVLVVVNIFFLCWNRQWWGDCCQEPMWKRANGGHIESFVSDLIALVVMCCLLSFCIFIFKVVLFCLWFEYKIIFFWCTIECKSGAYHALLHGSLLLRRFSPSRNTMNRYKPVDVSLYNGGHLYSCLNSRSFRKVTWQCNLLKFRRFAYKPVLSSMNLCSSVSATITRHKRP